MEKKNEEEIYSPKIKIQTNKIKEEIGCIKPKTLLPIEKKKKIVKTKVIKNDFAILKKKKLIRKKFKMEYQKLIVNNINEEIKINSQNYFICVCNYCKQLLIPFWVVKDISEQSTQEKKKCSKIHFQYLEKLKKIDGIKTTQNGNQFINLFISEQNFSVICFDEEINNLY